MKGGDKCKVSMHTPVKGVLKKALVVLKVDKEDQIEWLVHSKFILH